MGFNLALLAVGRGLPDLCSPLSDGCADVVQTLFPRTRLALGSPVPLDLGGFPERGELRIARFEGGMLIATRDAALFNPSKLPSRYLKPSLGREVTLLTQQSAYDMFAYARWVDGELVRSLSVNPVGKVWESIGDAEPWELQFRLTARPSEPDYPLPYHPLDMSDFALRRLLGLQFEGSPEPGLTDPSTVMLQSFTQ